MSHHGGLLIRTLIDQRDFLYGYVYALLRDINAAEEVFQEVALVAIREDQGGTDDIRDPLAWLREVARRLVKARYRLLSKSKILADQEYIERAADLIDRAESDTQDRLAALRECLKRVPASLREILENRYVRGMSYEAIGDLLQRSAGSLRVLVHRVQRELGDCVNARLSKEGA